jgi:hypothetical protein
MLEEREHLCTYVQQRHEQSRSASSIHHASEDLQKVHEVVPAALNRAVVPVREKHLKLE